MASEDPWEALSVGEVVSLLDGLPVRWWIAGGQAIDLFIGSSTRPHQDVDVAVLRPDQLAVQAHLDGWVGQRQPVCRIFAQRSYCWPDHHWLPLLAHQERAGPTG